MEKHRYEPVVLGVTMNQYGYRSVTISVSPGRRVSVMLCVEGITPDQAIQAALVTVGNINP